MNAIMKSFRFCGNSLSYITAFNLHLVGGPKFPDLLAYLASCGMRAADKTVVALLISTTNCLVYLVRRSPWLGIDTNRVPLRGGTHQHSALTCFYLLLTMSAVSCHILDCPVSGMCRPLGKKGFVRECLIPFQLGVNLLK